MALLTSAINTEFVPAIGNFRVQATGGNVVLQSKPVAGSEFAKDAEVIGGEAKIIQNVVLGTIYRFVPAALSGPAVVRADQ
jgi:hypothetical protein